ncbi:YhcH/YjgK/YiaL family protein [Parafilimonas sp.]|uniref:YhcH/YjgK/YiaL family protein n=1 Tax=Parafilimonas sp. TaxID=1969739 RepID=UPI0039E48F84
MIVDVLSNLEFYKSISTDFYEGLKFIQQADVEIPLGEYPLTPTAKAIVMEYETKVGENGFGYEAHRHLIDIQYCIKGSERIYWHNLDDALAPHTTYNAEKDFTFFTWVPEQGEVVIGNNVFSIFYPGDAHAPVFSTSDKPELIKKIVIKVSI